MKCCNNYDKCIALFLKEEGGEMSSIADNIMRVRERVEDAAVRVGRNPSEITIVAISKTFGPDKIMEAIRAGIKDIGENRVQEFLEKSTEVTLPCRWHLVGHLQTNKVNKVIGRFELIHSVDSVKLATKIGASSEREGLKTSILLEVNTSGEPSKYGFEPEEVVEAVAEIAGIRGVKVRGLMTVGPLTDDVSKISGAFSKLRELRDRVIGEGIEGVSMEHLSMGMTDDFEIAIAEGSTMLRLGRVIFGERVY